MINSQRPISSEHSRILARRRRPWTVTPAGLPVRSPPPSRRYEIAWLTEDGTPMDMVRVAPAIPAFETAFTGFARGALIQAPVGEIAIEDLQPGMLVMSRNGPLPVRWIGRMVLPPPNLRPDEGAGLFRLAFESLGPRRPAPDLVLCSGARLVHRTPRLVSRGAAEVLVPVEDFADGISVMKITPASAIPTYHFALDIHSVVSVNGVEVETFHPGPVLPADLVGDMGRLFHSMFPQLDASRSFGPMIMPRMGLEQIDRLAQTG